MGDSINLKTHTRCICMYAARTEKTKEATVFPVVILVIRKWNGGLLFILFLLISRYPRGRGVRVCFVLFLKSVFLYSFSFSFSLNQKHIYECQ